MQISVRTTGASKQSDYEWRTHSTSGLLVCDAHSLWVWTDGSGKSNLIVRKNANGDFSILLGSLLSQQLDSQCRPIQIVVAVDGLHDEQARALAHCYLTNKPRIEATVRDHIKYAEGDWTVQFSTLKVALGILASQMPIKSSLEPKGRGKFAHSYSGKTFGKIAFHVSLHRFSESAGIKLLVVDVPKLVKGWDDITDIFSQGVERNALWQEIGHESETWIPFDLDVAVQATESNDTAVVPFDLAAVEDYVEKHPWRILAVAAGIGVLAATLLRSKKKD